MDRHELERAGLAAGKNRTGGDPDTPPLDQADPTHSQPKVYDVAIPGVGTVRLQNASVAQAAARIAKQNPSVQPNDLPALAMGEATKTGRYRS